MEELLSPPKRVLIGPHGLEGDLLLPQRARALIVFAHASGATRRSPRNQHVAQFMHEQQLGTLLFDLLRPDEAKDENAHVDVALLSRRIGEVIDWLDRRPALCALPIGLFGAGTGAAAALDAAAANPKRIFAIVSRGGRPDLAHTALSRVHASTLLIAGGADAEAVALNRNAARRLKDPSELAIVPGVANLLEEHAALDRVTQLATDWFIAHLPKNARAAWPA